MSLGNLCRREIICVNRGATVEEVAKLMEEKNIGSIIVVEERKPMGIVTDRDILLRVINRGLDSKRTSVADVMTQSCYSTILETAVLVLDVLIKVRADLIYSVF